jgi:hypothetical protein
MTIEPEAQAVEVTAAVARLPSTIAVPTRTGKTVVFSQLITASNSPALLLVHRDELIGQAAQMLAMAAPESSRPGGTAHQAAIAAGFQKKTITVPVDLEGGIEGASFLKFNARLKLKRYRLSLGPGPGRRESQSEY